jgi:hypothetical protein
MGSGPGFKLSRVFPQSTTPHHQNSTVSNQLHLWLRVAGLTSIFHCLPMTLAVPVAGSQASVRRAQPPRTTQRRGCAWEIVGDPEGRWGVRWSKESAPLSTGMRVDYLLVALMKVGNPLVGSDPLGEFPRLFVLIISAPHSPAVRQRSIPKR